MSTLGQIKCAWTEQRVETLKHMWLVERQTASACGRALGISRCAVLGKVHRLGLGGRAVSQRIKGHKYSRVRPPRRKHRIIPEALVADARARRAAATLEGQIRHEIQSKPDIPAKNPKTVETLELGDCRWPYGDPQTKEFHFCGDKKIPGGPYCEYHRRRAFQPPNPNVKATIGGAMSGAWIPTATGMQSNGVFKNVEDFLEVVK